MYQKLSWLVTLYDYKAKKKSYLDKMDDQYVYLYELAMSSQLNFWSICLFVWTMNGQNLFVWNGWSICFSERAVRRIVLHHTTIDTDWPCSSKRKCSTKFVNELLDHGNDTSTKGLTETA